MKKQDERAKILSLIQEGEIGTEEGIRRIQALNDQPEEAQTDERLQLLDQIAAGKLSPGEAIQQLTADPAPTDEIFVSSPINEGPYEADAEPMPEPPDFDKWRSWWVVPMWVGVGITVIGGAILFAVYQAAGPNFWFFCSWLPFLLGVAVLFLAWRSRTARWLHVRVKQPKGQTPRNIIVSFPLPLRFSAWLLRNFGHFIPNMGDTALDEVVLALENITPDAPFYVDVQEGEDGEHVQVYIG